MKFLNFFTIFLLIESFLFQYSFATSLNNQNPANHENSENLPPIEMKFVLKNEDILIPKTTGFIEILSNEVLEKTGISLYIAAIDSIESFTFAESNKTDSIESKIKTAQNKITKDLQSPFILLFFSKQEKKINIITSSEQVLPKELKNEVYWDYIVPLIPTNAGDLTKERMSAFLLNGFVDIADKIAERAGIAELEHNFPKQNKGIKVATQAALYGMLGILLVLFIFASNRERFSRLFSKFRKNG